MYGYSAVRYVLHSMSNPNPHPPPNMPRRKFYLLRLWMENQEQRWRASLQGIAHTFQYTMAAKGI